MNIKKLTKAERRHLREFNSLSVVGVRRLLARTTANGVVCWECRKIARKLGIDPDNP